MAEVIPMGIGRLGFQNLTFKKKHRFTFQIENICGGGFIPQHYVKVAGRPKIEIDETEFNFLNATTWMPGKAKWQTINVTYVDVATADIAPLYTWLASIYDFTDPINLHMGSQRRDYSARAVLKMWDGCGQLIERWIMADAWPTSIDFGETDYASSDEATIELTLRYSQVRYEPVCPSFPIRSCCSPCR